MDKFTRVEMPVLIRANLLDLFSIFKRNAVNAKLTLTLDDSVIEKAKSYARSNGRSLSDLVENYFKALASEDNNGEVSGLTPIVQSLKGSFKAPENFDYKDELNKALSEKYSNK